MLIKDDPLKGALPPAPNTTGSPALAGQPPSITGAQPNLPVPDMQGQGSALAPASPGSGSANIGAPLSNAAPEQQAGAGANLDLVKDRGTPDEFHAKNLAEVGSERATSLAFEIIGGRNNSMGVAPEDIRRQGARANASLGMETPEKAQQIVNEVVFKPTLATMRAEVDQEVISADDAGIRGTQLIANVNGAETEDDLKEIAMEVHNETTGETIKKNKVEDLNWWGSVKKWWNKGKGNPDEQVTGFMGGMNRNELGMFVFQWGALMMANSSEGLGPAMGMAGMGAIAGHQGRETQAQQSALEERKVAAAEMTAGAAQTRAEAESNKTANIQWGKDGAYVIERQEDGTWKAVPLKDSETSAQLAPGLTPGSKQGQFRDQWMYDQMIAAGYTERQAVDFINGAPTESEVKLTVQRVWLSYDDRQKLRSPISGEVKNKSEFTEAEYKKWLDEQVGAWSSGGALPPTTDPGKDAVDEYSE